VHESLDAAFEATYGPYVGKDLAITLVEKAMMRPPETTCCAACDSTRNVPRRFVAITR
jgi:hypothetical protein